MSTWTPFTAGSLIPSTGLDDCCPGLSDPYGTDCGRGGARPLGALTVPAGEARTRGRRRRPATASGTPRPAPGTPLASGFHGGASSFRWARASAPARNAAPVPRPPERARPFPPLAGPHAGPNAFRAPRGRGQGLPRCSQRRVTPCTAAPCRPGPNGPPLTTPGTERPACPRPHSGAGRRPPEGLGHMGPYHMGEDAAREGI